MANNHAQRFVNDGTYVAKTAKCFRHYPHVFLCELSFDTAATQPTNRYACIERLYVLYDNHDDYSAGYRHFDDNRLCD